MEGRMQPPLSCMAAPILIATWSVFAFIPLSCRSEAAFDDFGVGGHEGRQRAQTHSLTCHWRLFPQEWQILTLQLQINFTRLLFPLSLLSPPFSVLGLNVLHQHQAICQWLSRLRLRQRLVSSAHRDWGSTSRVKHAKLPFVSVKHCSWNKHIRPCCYSHRWCVSYVAADALMEMAVHLLL